MSTRPRTTTRNRMPIGSRAAYSRTAGNFLVNDPDGFPSEFPPVSWLSPGAGGPGSWWIGLDSGGGAVPIGPNGPWPAGYGSAQPVITRATSLICGPLTAAPFRLLVGGQIAIGQSPRWLADPMLLRPDARFVDEVYPSVVKLPRGEFWASWIRFAIWWGLGAFLWQPDETGQPVAGTLRLVDPRYLSTDRDDAGALHWTLDGGDGYPAVFDRDGSLTLGPVTYRLTVLRNPHSPVDAEGMSLGVFAANPGTYQLGSELATYSAGQFRSGVPNGYLKVETPGLTQTAANELKAKWMENHGGDRRSIAVLNATTSFTPINLNPVDAALAEVKRLNIADVAYSFGLDPMTLGVSLANSATYNNVRDAWLNHRDYGLAPWITAVQDVLSALLPAGRDVAVNLDGFANPTARERFIAYQTAITAGILTVDEARALEGLPPLAAPVEED